MSLQAIGKGFAWAYLLLMATTPFWALAAIALAPLFR